MTEFTIKFGEENPRDVAAYFRAHASQIPETWKERAALFQYLADQIEAQIQPPVPLNVYKSGPPGPAVQQPEQFSAPKPAPLGLALYPTEASIPVEKVRQVLRSSPTGYLSDEEVLTAYKDLRKRLAALLPEGAQ
jgi:hypothetical protein